MPTSDEVLLAVSLGMGLIILLSKYLQDWRTGREFQLRCYLVIVHQKTEQEFSALQDCSKLLPGKSFTLQSADRMIQASFSLLLAFRPLRSQKLSSRVCMALQGYLA